MLQRRDEGAHGRSYRPKHTMGALCDGDGRFQHRSDPRSAVTPGQSGSVGRHGPTLKICAALRAAGRSVGSFRPSIFLAALRAAGRSVGPDRLKTASKRNPWVGRSGTQRLESTSHRPTPPATYPKRLTRKMVHNLCLRFGWPAFGTTIEHRPLNRGVGHQLMCTIPECVFL